MSEPEAVVDDHVETKVLASPADALAMMRVYREDQLKLERRLAKVEQVIEQLRAWLGGKPRRPAPGWKRRKRDDVRRQG